jgi:hypothetical protein
MSTQRISEPNAQIAKSITNELNALDLQQKRNLTGAGSLESCFKFASQTKDDDQIEVLTQVIGSVKDGVRQAIIQDLLSDNPALRAHVVVLRKIPKVQEEMFKLATDFKFLDNFITNGQTIMQLPENFNINPELANTLAYQFYNEASL